MFAQRLDQQGKSFDLALSLIKVSALMTFVGVVLLLSGKVSEGSAITAGGLTGNVFSARFLKFTENANDRLDRLLDEQLLNGINR